MCNLYRKKERPRLWRACAPILILLDRFLVCVPWGFFLYPILRPMFFALLDMIQVNKQTSGVRHISISGLKKCRHHRSALLIFLGRSGKQIIVNES
ncbi:hypothetical protein BCR43DRAFT_488371 [Syncephalastrum racemosum]|uniref:Uncharacterized protein n=1 Tax=Syncephalastrum racemosum TaxID=13706 RepID=A0A1X2HIH9_SYNRA|nr:hypothetical protein BCR43DRAFT_488371 [Syncephalastrum racemosum]